MQEELATKLEYKAQDLAKKMSNPKREYNKNQESFVVEAIKPLSDMTATVTFKKSSGKRALGFFYYVRGYSDWSAFFPTDSHILGMSMFGDLKQKIEEVNFSLRDHKQAQTSAQDEDLNIEFI